MLPYRDSIFARVALGLFFIALIFYAYYEARGVLYGPTISVPDKVITVQDQFITIKGRADRISKLEMNGKSIPVTEEGYFEEPYVLAEGYNRISLKAEDRYGRSTERFVEIMYEGADAPSASPAATSSTATSMPPAAEAE